MPVYLVSRNFSSARPSYVRELPGEDGADYGYCDDATKARRLTERQAKRAAKYLREVGAAGVKVVEVTATQAEREAEIDRYIGLAIKAEERRDACEWESADYWRHHDVAMGWHERARRLMPKGS